MKPDASTLTATGPLREKSSAVVLDRRAEFVLAELG